MALLALSGCKPWSPDLDPPTRNQIACSSGAVVMVFVLDTGRDLAVWANGPDAPEGRLETSDYSHRMVFSATPGRPAVEARVNRYDGAMEVEAGVAPFFASGPLKAGNRRTRLNCTAQPLKTKV
ncbi:hypothetical protein [Brevundimonas nasdae]|uniref:Lipoprotein n=1 Tax=Brevundimonas nasdae TaxID=172043 RepID=A0ABX8TJR9_9CAUL|nr:hypothetical protein [Brevundimonas nasdae]QYC11467.1 hypothetical protein KWG56_05690 [Brevundimonas nasdae]QYC14255.1 hypothetical protein KWG63_01025 [Brevundimonas nasdae]